MRSSGKGRNWVPRPSKVSSWYSFLLKFRRRCFARLENTDFSFFPHRIQGRNISSLGLRRASDNQTEIFPNMQVIIKDDLSWNLEVFEKRIGKSRL